MFIVPCVLLDLFFKICLFFWKLRIPFHVLIFKTMTVIQGIISIKISSDKKTYNTMYHLLFLKLVALVWYGSHNIISSLSIPSNVIVSFVILLNIRMEVSLSSLCLSFNATFAIIVRYISSSVHCTISKNFGILYNIEKVMGRKNSRCLKCVRFIGWQTLIYRSMAILIVTATDPTRPIWAKPILKMILPKV